MDRLAELRGEVILLATRRSDGPKQHGEPEGRGHESQREKYCPQSAILENVC